MCGIFAYRGPQDAASVVFHGLKQLEYRGYDSWGVGIPWRGHVRVVKKVGKIGSAQLYLPKTHVAFGHTRWATHGGVTRENAHPHLDCSQRFAVAHNGIIENNEQLCAALKRKGHTFVSQTDTEVCAHLIEEEMKKSERRDFCEAVYAAFAELKGYNTIVVLDALSQTIVACRFGSPLIFGKKDEEVFLSSDIPSLLSSTHNVAVIDEGRGVVITKDDAYGVLLRTKQRFELQTAVVSMDQSIVEKGKYANHMLKEIMDQPETLSRIGSLPSSTFLRASNVMKHADALYGTACGSALYALMASGYFFSKIAAKQLIPIPANEFSSFSHLLSKESVLLAASQSGETSDTIHAVRDAKMQKACTVSMVNVPLSTLDRESDVVLSLQAGVEQAVLSTKAFSAKLAMTFLLSHAIHGSFSRGSLLIMKASRMVQKMLQERLWKNQVQSCAEFCARKEHIFFIGRGIQYPIAMEAALKMKEAAYIHAEGFAGGELKHGVLALIEKGTLCGVLVANDDSKTAILSNAAELKARGATILGIGPKKETVFDLWIQTPEMGDLSCIGHLLSIQTLAYDTAILRKVNPDMPRNLAKAVTVA